MCKNNIQYFYRSHRAVTQTTQYTVHSCGQTTLIIRPLLVCMPQRKVSSPSSLLRSSLTLESVSYSCTSSESSCWSCGWMSEAVVSISSGKCLVGETTFSAGVYEEWYIMRGSVAALNLTWPWYIKFLESLHWNYISRKKLANYRPWSRMSRNKLVISWITGLLLFTHHGNSFVHDSRRLKIGVHGSR